MLVAEAKIRDDLAVPLDISSLEIRQKPPAFADREMTDTFLRELDRLQAATAGRLAIIGGTYRIDVVDQALVKDKSRFNRKVFLPPPDRADLAVSRPTVLEAPPPVALVR